MKQNSNWYFPINKSSRSRRREQQSRVRLSISPMGEFNGWRNHLTQITYVYSYRSTAEIYSKVLTPKRQKHRKQRFVVTYLPLNCRVQVSNPTS